MAIRDRQGHGIILVLLSLVLVVGAWLRVHGLDSESMNLDEVYSARLSENPIPGILEGLKTDAHPPLYFILLHGWISLFGNEATAVRSLSMLFGILAVFAAYKVASLLSDRVTGLWSGLLVAISPFFIRYSQETRSYSLLLLLSLLSFYYFAKLVLDYGKQGRKDRALYILFTVLVIYTHIYGLFIFAAQGIFLLTQWIRKEEPWRKWVFSLSIISAAFLLWMPVLYFQAFKGREHFILQPPTLETVRDTLFAFGGSWPLFFILLVLIGVGFRGRQGDSGKRNLLLASWCLVPVIFPMLISFVKPMYMTRYTIGATAAFYLLAARGMTVFRPRWPIPIAAGILVVLYLPVLKDYYEKPNKEDWRSIVRFVQEREAPGDVILVAPAKGALPVRYYYRGGTPIYPLNPHGYLLRNNLRPYGLTDEIDLPEDATTVLSVIIGDKKRVWLVLRNEALSYRVDETLRVALHGRVPAVEKRIHGGKVYLFETDGGSAGGGR